MRVKKITFVLFTCMAFGACGASAAEAAGWEVGSTENQKGAGTVLAGEESIVCTTIFGQSLTVTGTLIGSGVKLTATGVECVEFRISNTPGGHTEGKIRLTNLSVDQPLHCEVGGPSHEVTSVPFTDTVFMDPFTGSHAYFDKWVSPKFITKFAGALCPLAEAEAEVTGTACGESVHTTGAKTFESSETGTLTKIQTFLFGSAQQTTGGCELKLGNSVAQLSGAINFELSGAQGGKPWGVS